MDNNYLNAGTPAELTLDEYITPSLDLAAWLVCQGFPLQRLDPPAPSDPRHLTRFVFARTDTLTDAVTTWKSGQPVRDTDLHRYIGAKKDMYARVRSLSSQGGQHGQ